LSYCKPLTETPGTDYSENWAKPARPYWTSRTSGKSLRGRFQCGTDQQSANRSVNQYPLEVERPERVLEKSVSPAQQMGCGAEGFTEAELLPTNRICGSGKGQ